MTMRIQIDAGSAGDVKADTVVIPITRRGETPTTLPQGISGLDRRMGGRLSDAIASGDFKGGAGDRLVIYGPQNGDLVRVVFLGLGEAEGLDVAGLRDFGGRVGREANREENGRIALVLPPGAGLAPERAVPVIAEGALLGSYRFDQYKSGGRKKRTATKRLRIVTVRKIKGSPRSARDQAVGPDRRVPARRARSLERAAERSTRKPWPARPARWPARSASSARS